MRYRPKYLLAALEAIYGTPEVLAAGDAVRTTGLDLVGYDGNTITRDLDSKDFGNESQINVNPHVTMSFGVEVTGGGAAGTAPPFGALLQACGLLETVNVATDVVYTLTRTGIKSVTGMFARPDTAGNQQQHRSAGMRGNMGLEIANGRIPMLQFDGFRGSFIAPVSAAEIVPDFSAYFDPEPVTNTNTPTMTIDGYAVCLESLSFNLGNQIERVNVPGCEETMITDVLPTLTAVIKAPTISEKNYWAKLVNHEGTIHDDIAVIASHGSAAGKILELGITHCQLIGVREQELRREVGYSLELAPISGISLTVK